MYIRLTANNASGAKKQEVPHTELPVLLHHVYLIKLLWRSLRLRCLQLLPYQQRR